MYEEEYEKALAKMTDKIVNYRGVHPELLVHEVEALRALYKD